MQPLIKTVLLLAYGFGLVERSLALVYRVRSGSWFQLALAFTLGLLTWLIELP